MEATDALRYLRRCVELAREALEAGDAPFGSVLVNKNGDILQEDRNRTVTDNNASLHPEFTLAVWAQKNLSPDERAAATVYTSGEHCPMCSAAHAYAGLGGIVYASSSKQLIQWKEELGVSKGPVRALAINEVAPMLKVEGPSEELADEILTRTHKNNDRDHVGLAAGTAGPEEHLPRYFAKAGYAGENPANTKKQGGGKGNWGREGHSELEDYDFNTTKSRRRTNSSTAAAGHSMLKTKFEAIDPEVIEYEEDLHGPSPDEMADGKDGELEKMSTTSSADTMGSVEEEDSVAKK